MQCTLIYIYYIYIYIYIYIYHHNTQFNHDENDLQEFDSVDVNNENILPITEQEVKYI